MQANCWQIIEEGPFPPEQNMESDYQKLLDLDQSSLPALRFYQWQLNSATYGYFLKPFDHLKPELLNLAKRPTGGGIIFHDYDLAFSLLIPASHSHYSLNTLDNYSYVNSRLLSGLKKFNPLLPVQFYSSQGESKPNFCMARSTIYDLIINGKKVVGGAMRKTRKGFLHQGSICLRLPEKDFLNIVLNESSYKEEIMSHSYPLLQGVGETAYEDQKETLKQCIIESFLSL